MDPIRKGITFHVNGDEHIVDGIIDDDVYVERIKDNKLTKYSLAEVQLLAADSIKKGWYTGEWPIRVTATVFADEYPFEEQLRELGVGEEYRNMFKHTLSNIDLELDLQKSGRAQIKVINGIEIHGRINAR